MDQDFKVGEFIIDFACIYEITSITQEKNSDIKLIHYQPIKGTDKVFVDTIPEKKLIKSGLRRLLNEKEIKFFLDQLKTEKKIENYIFDPRQIKEDIYQNIPEKLIEHLQYLFKNNETLSRSDQDLKNEILNHLCLEISFVSGKSIFLTKKTIESNFTKQISKTS